MKVKLLQRPPFESPLERLKFSVSSSLVQELAKADPDQIEHSTITSCSKIKHGTPCLNRGCKEVRKSKWKIILDNYVLFVWNLSTRHFLMNPAMMGFVLITLGVQYFMKVSNTGLAALDVQLIFKPFSTRKVVQLAHICGKLVMWVALFGEQ